MAQHPAYPEPDAGPEAIHPYANQYPMPPSSHSHIPIPVEASMRRDSSGSNSFLQGNGHLAVHPQPATPQQLAQRSLDVNQEADENDPDSTSRKRSKVSRACDECRRKKIRCDAESEAPGTTCSSCRRAGITCDFSRAPQKRGPSKGYIKELAERVNILEYRTGAAPPDIPYSSGESAPQGNFLDTNEFVARKRPYENLGGQAYYDHSYNPLQDIPPRQERTHQDPVIREETGGEGISQTELQSANMDAVKAHEKGLQIYYELIHHILPLLPPSTAGVQLTIAKVPTGLSEAFFRALEAAVAAYTQPNAEEPVKAAGAYLQIINFDRQYVETVLAKVVYLQSLILMIIATNSIGPYYEFRARWIAAAVAIGQNLNLHHIPRSDDPKDPNTNLLRDAGRRAWLILYILDRWHGLGNPDVLHMPEEHCQLIDSDYDLLGGHPYHLFRISRIAGHLCKGYTFETFGLTELYNHRGALAESMDGEINGFRESVRNHLSRMPHIHLAYLHVRNIADRYLAMNEMNTRKVIDGAYEIVGLLKADKGYHTTPWTHQMIALATLTLGKAADHQLHPGATAALQELRDALDSSQLRRHNAKTGWDVTIGASITNRLSSGGLTELADAAMVDADGANGPGDHGPGSWDGQPDWTITVSHGYLKAFE